MAAPRPTCVFISYSHDSPEHVLHVRSMAMMMRAKGFEVLLDEWDTPPKRWPAEIERWFRRADALVCVCTPTYRDRFNGEVAPGQGRGAAQEGELIRNEAFDLARHSDRFHVVRMEDAKCVVPDTLGGLGTQVYQWPDQRAGLLKALEIPTKRRTLVDACASAFGEDVVPLDEWARQHVHLGKDKVLDFDLRVRRIVDDVLRLDEPEAMRDALASLVGRLEGEPRERVVAVVKELGLGTIRLGRSATGVASSSLPESTGIDVGDPVSAGELSRYLAKTESQHQDIPLIGFKTKARLSMQLYDLYVPLDAMIDRGGRGRDVYAGAEVAEMAKGRDPLLQREQIPLAKAFERAKEMSRRGLVLLGDPGSGKTTHLKQLLLKVKRHGPESVGLPAGTVPVFLPLRDLQDREAGLPGFIQQQLQGPSLGMKPDFGLRLCQRGRLLLLLDGLDEVADAEERALVSRWIEDARVDMPESYFLVSCRYAGYSDEVELDARFLELHLRPFDDQQMTTFVTRWYATVERELCRDPEQAAILASERAQELLEILSGSEFTSVGRVYQLTRNPLLLTTICLVHRDLGRLPHARAKLYEESIAVLLERWRRRSSGGVPLTADEVVEVLQPAAEWMHEQQGRTRATKAELLVPVGRGLSRLRDAKISAERFLEVVRDDSGLLTGWGVDAFGFMHLGFQEFLTAQRIRNEGLKAPRVFAKLAGRFGESWWQEVILLMLAQRNPSVFEQFMREVVRQPDFPKWGVSSETMALALTEAAEVSPVPFVELLEVVDADDATLEDRQLAAVRLLARSMPAALKGLETLLREHPTATVRAWWRERQRHGGREAEVIVAPRGGVELVLISDGTFMMGSPNGVGDDDEYPQHEVELASFYLAKTPVTNAQYGQFLKARPDTSKPRYWGDRNFNQPNQPVVGVSWDEAKAYCEWAGLSLPTEAQWEYACRAGATTRYHSGDSEQDLARVGWYSGNSKGRLHAVGEKEPNDFGLYDMHGNVWEWCLDNYGSYATRPRPKDGLRYEPEGGTFRVMRGGGWSNDADIERSAFRISRRPGIRGDVLGFRPVLRLREVGKSSE